MAVRMKHEASVIRYSSIGTLDTCIYVHVTYSQMHNILSKRHYRTYCKPPWHISLQIGEKLLAACPRMSCNGELDEWAHHYSQLQVDFHWPIWIWILRDYILDVMLTVCYQLSLQINDVKLILLSEQHGNLTKIFWEVIYTMCRYTQLQYGYKGQKQAGGCLLILSLCV